MDKMLNPADIFKKLDNTGDGKITQEDFIVAAEHLGLGFLGKHAAKIAFKHFDVNKNGTLELNEAVAAIHKLADQVNNSNAETK